MYQTFDITGWKNFRRSVSQSPCVQSRFISRPSVVRPLIYSGGGRGDFLHQLKRNRTRDRCMTTAKIHPPTVSLSDVYGWIGISLPRTTNAAFRSLIGQGPLEDWRRLQLQVSVSFSAKPRLAKLTCAHTPRLLELSQLINRKSHQPNSRSV
jgi:hypothetical protein